MPVAPSRTIAFVPPSGALTPSVAEVAWTPEEVALRDDVVAASIYRPSERLVRLTDPMDLEGLIADHGLTVIRPVGRSGFAVLAGPLEALRSMSEDGRVALLQPHAHVHAASDELTGAQLAGTALTAAEAAQQGLQWHRPVLNLPNPSPDYSAYTVAVLDSGVAYETATRDGVNYTQAPGLAGVPIRHPFDPLNGDLHANDDNQHGTHIASLIAATGALPGVAPGVGLMPVKVLDADNTGNEFALVEGIYHAVDHGADVINMSLSFSEGYQPSAALLDALDYAYAQGVVMIAATGNSGSDQLSWPASSPLVMSVAASQLNANQGAQPGVSYANANSGVDLCAPAGRLDVDVDGNGVVDGVVAEAIDPRDPTKVGVWMMAGTSQAAAVASGIAIETLRRGTAHASVRLDMQNMADLAGYLKGAGTTNIGGGTYNATTHNLNERGYEVVVLPYVERLADGVRPRARVTLVLNGEMVSPTHQSFQVEGQIYGVGQSGRSVCTLHRASNSWCDLVGDTVNASDSSTLEAAWMVEVQGLYRKGTRMSYRPSMAITVTDALQTAVGALQSDSRTSQALVAWSFSDTADPQLGDIAASYSAVNTGTGLASLPLGLMITPTLMNKMGTSQSLTLTTGSTDLQVELLSLDGSGLASIPLGLRRLDLVAIDQNNALGVTAGSMHGEGDFAVSLGGSGLASLPLGFSSTPVGGQLRNGGWTVDGYAAGSALASSSTLAISPGFATEL